MDHRTRFAIAKALRETGGALIQEYDQGEDDRLNVLDTTNGGWCYGMSIYWLRALKEGRLDRFWTHHRTAKAAGEYRFVMAYQQITSSSIARSNDYWFASKPLLTRVGLHPVMGLPDNVGIGQLQMNPNVGAQMIANAILGYQGEYHLIYVMFRQASVYQGAAHAMACHADYTKIRFMDPNAGEYLFEGGAYANFSQFLPKFFRALAYENAIESQGIEKFQ